MKTTTSIVLLVLAFCLLSVPGTWAQTEGWSSYGQNVLTGSGVIGAEYLGSNDFNSAVSGKALSSSGSVYGGYFKNASSSGKAVYGLASAKTGLAYGGYFQSESGWGVYGVVRLKRNLGMPLAALSLAKATQAKG